MTHVVSAITTAKVYYLYPTIAPTIILYFIDTYMQSAKTSAGDFMQTRLDEVDIFDSYTDDPDAENSIMYSGSATPVYLTELEPGLPMLTNSPETGDKLFGHMHRYQNPDDEEGSRLIVVKVE